MAGGQRRSVGRSFLLGDIQEKLPTSTEYAWRKATIFKGLSGTIRLLVRTSKESASCGHRPVRPKQPQRIETQLLGDRANTSSRKPLILLVLWVWLLRLDSNQQPSG